MIMINKKNKRLCARHGYTLIELLFYIALFTIISLAVINTLITMTRAFKETTIQAELSQSGAIMERMSREIRKANNINFSDSGNLVIATKDDAGVDKTVEFLLLSGNIELLENSVLIGNLNTPNISVSILTFTQIITYDSVKTTLIKSKAVKIFFSVQSKNDSLSRSFDFYDTIVLRGSY